MNSDNLNSDNLNIHKTFEDLQKNVDVFKMGIDKLNVKQVSSRSQMIAYHYNEVLHNLKQIDYHMDQIGRHCRMVLGESWTEPETSTRTSTKPKHPSIRLSADKNIVRNRIKQFDSMLRLSYLEDEFKSIDNILVQKEASSRHYKSMESLVNPKSGLSAVDFEVDVTDDVSTVTKDEGDEQVEEVVENFKPRIISVDMKPKEEEEEK